MLRILVLEMIELACIGLFFTFIAFVAIGMQ
jgi:hypothetical protein